MLKLTSILFCWSLALIPFASRAAEDAPDLPTLGDYTSGIVSLEQERALGQQFLRALRAGAPLVSDPILQEYLELLIYKLASHSKLQDRRIELVVINDTSINAFAAPGGIVGINLGLFLHAETESEISAILSHELAHLSQRHYARGTEANKKATMTNMAGLLAGVILMSVGGGEAGIAAISAGQGLAQSEMLRYSRSREKEADGVGIDTLVLADLDPRAMAYMFERLSRANRFSGRDIPEFLLTHPVTKDRIADSYAKTENMPKKIFAPSLDYQMMRARVKVMTADSPTGVLQQMKDEIQNPEPVSRMAAQYGLALAQTQAGQLDNAGLTILALQQASPGKIAFVLAEAELHLRAQRYESAVDVLAPALKLSPGNYPLSMAYAEALMKSKQAPKAAEVLTRLTLQRPNDKDIWYMLAEARGLSNDIVGVHEARAEYFVLVGNFDQAIKQLGFATPLVRDKFQQHARIQQRIEQIHKLQQKPKKS